MSDIIIPLLGSSSLVASISYSAMGMERLADGDFVGSSSSFATSYSLCSSSDVLFKVAPKGITEKELIEDVILRIDKRCKSENVPFNDVLLSRAADKLAKDPNYKSDSKMSMVNRLAKGIKEEHDNQLDSDRQIKKYSSMQKSHTDYRSLMKSATKETTKTSSLTKEF